MRYYRLLDALVLAVLTACGGASSVLAPSLRPATTAGQTPSVADFTFSIPARDPSSFARAPLYVSINSQSFVILTDGANPVTIDVNASALACRTIGNGDSLSCTIAIPTTAGRHDFVITSYSQTKGQGSALSTNSTGPINVPSGSRTPIAITLEGIVASAELVLQATNPPASMAVRIPLSVILKDASGAIIVGNGPFNDPVTLTSSDTVNGPLSTTTLSSPADEAGITANYNGANVPGITYSAIGKGLAGKVRNAVLTPMATKVGATKIYVVSSGTSTLTTYTASGAPTTPTITVGLHEPTSVAVDAAGKIYVANRGDNTVTTFDSNGTPSAPTITGLSNPKVAVDAAGKIYVLNQDANMVTTYTAKGTPATPTITSDPPCSSCVRENRGIAVDVTGKIYVASTTYEYERFNLIDMIGAVMTYTATGAPTGPTIGKDHNGIVECAVTVWAGKIYVVSADCGGRGDYSENALTTYTATGVQTAPSIAGLRNPTAVAVDGAGKIYIVTAGDNMLQTFAANGTRITPTITGLIDPVGIAVH